MAFEPFSETSGHHQRSPYITPVSQLPGVELDITESTSAILKVPFIHPNNYFQVEFNTTDAEELGSLVLYAYTPLSVAPGTGAPTLSLWFWLEDFELIGAATTDIMAQSGKFQRKSLNSSSLEAQAVPGNVSNVLSAGSNLITWLGKKIPLISSYSGPAAWVLREAGNVAASYGWAKPIVSVVPAKMMNTLNTHQFNCDGPDPAFNLGSTTDNAIVPCSGFAGTDVDEMAFNYVTSIHAAIASPTLVAGVSTDTIVYACSLSPSSLYNNGTSLNRRNGFKTTGTFFYTSPLYSLGNIFKYWKGGIKFRIKIAKTKFHTGRLILGFNPRPPSDAAIVRTPLDPTDMQFKSVIWDLREGNVMDFECPFISPTPYLQMDSAFGDFFIAVLDPLRGPDTVADTAPMVIEVAGMDDIEYSVPITPVEPVAPTSGVYFPQSGEFEPIMSTDVTPSSQLCVGEKLNSVKQLVSRSQAIYTPTGGSFSNCTSTFLYPIWQTSSINPTGLSRIDNSFIAYFQAAYALARGGFCIDAIPIKPGTTFTAVSEMSFSAIENMALVSESRTGVHIKMPYFNIRSRHITGPNNYTLPDNNVSIATTGTGAFRRGIIYRRLADDFQLGYFIGFPPLTARYADTTSLANNMLTTITDTSANNSADEGISIQPVEEPPTAPEDVVPVTFPHTFNKWVTGSPKKPSCSTPTPPPLLETIVSDAEDR